MGKVLLAGVGNALKGDDAFGVRAAALLSIDPRLPSNAIVIETGIGGIHLVQELMRGYDALVILDAFDRGGTPGELFLLEPEVPDPDEMSDRAKRDFFADVHYATPIRALTLARAVGALPAVLRIIGCQPSDPDAFTLTMHESVEKAVPHAVELALRLIRELGKVERHIATSST